MTKSFLRIFFLFFFIITEFFVCRIMSQERQWVLTPKNISSALAEDSILAASDTLRPAFHLVPPAGCMGDPNGGIYHQGWYHIFYGLQPFSSSPGGWYWAHARSRDLLIWEHTPPAHTPAFEFGLGAVGSGSTITAADGHVYAFYSAAGKDGKMKFWQARFNSDLSAWQHSAVNPVLTLDQPGIPPFDRFWRDPFVFTAGGKTFLIACADLFEADDVSVPIFEARNAQLTQWEYKGIMFTYPKYKARNLEVPELRKLDNKWILLASTDAPVDRCLYFIGNFDVNSLRFIAEKEGIIDYSGHYYAQETIRDDKGNLYLMAWIPGWDRDWLPAYMNSPLKNSSPLWNGCFALPRQLMIDPDGSLVQKPVDVLKQLRTVHRVIEGRDLPVTSAFTAYDVIEEIKGNQLEIKMEMDLHHASFCGINVLCNREGRKGLFICWSGSIINVDGVIVPLPEWKQGQTLRLHIFIDRQLVEVFINEGRYCVSRKVQPECIGGRYIALTRLGGTARLVSLEAWQLKAVRP